MIGRMEQYYDLKYNDLKVEKVTEGAYYATKYDDWWCRVKIIKQEGENVLCFFIDYGDEILVPLNTIYQLKREYALFQAQVRVYWDGILLND